MSILSVDFHTHILPGVDDGAPNVDEAIEMLRMEYEQGVRKVFLTPHFNAHEDFPDTFIERRKNSLDNLRLTMENPSEYPELELGAEVRFTPGMSAWEQLPSLVLGNSKYILIEMPGSVWSNETYQELENIYKKQALIPVLAHIERYLLPLKMNSTLRKLSALPVLLQFNCDFFVESRTRRIAKRLLKKGFVHLVGSDCHSATWRAPNIEQARNQIIKFADETLIKRIKGTEKSVAKSQ